MNTEEIDRADVEDVTRPHEHWCAVCGIGMGGI